MNELQKLILNNKDNWESLLDDLGVDVKRDNGYIMCKYRAYFYDKPPVLDSIVVQNSRGIILDEQDNYKIVCHPFDKFFNYFEKWFNVESIDWNTSYAIEKIDGSLVNLWWSDRDNKWIFSTSGTIYASKASSRDKTKSFIDLIMETRDYKKIDFDVLDKDYTYIFELVHPQQKIVIKYTLPKLYHLATRHNKFGHYVEIDLGIEKPERHKVKTLTDTITLAEKMNEGLDVIKHEGYVICDAEGNRVKVKTKEYISIHKFETQYIIKKEDVIEQLYNGDKVLLDSMSNYPKMIVSFYMHEWYKLLYTIEYKIDQFRILFDELDGDRKKFAELVKQDKYSAFAFLSIKYTEETVEELVRRFRLATINKLIPDYEGFKYE